MKKLVVTMVIAIAFMTVTVAAGTDATNSWLTIKAVVINGTNAMEVVAYYPSSWTLRNFQTSSDLSNSNNWGGIMLSEQVVPRVNAPTGELPRWTRWTVNSGDTVGSRFFRLVKQ